MNIPCNHHWIMWRDAKGRLVVSCKRCLLRPSQDVKMPFTALSRPFDPFGDVKCSKT